MLNGRKITKELLNELDKAQRTKFVAVDALLDKAYTIYIPEDPEELFSHEQTHHVVSVEDIKNAPAIWFSQPTVAQWKYYHKQNKAVCTNCSFERDLSVSFGQAITCPNCGAYIRR